MISLILAVLLLLVIIVAIGCGIGLIFLLFYLPAVSCMDGYTRLRYGEFRALYAAAPNDWDVSWGSVTYTGGNCYTDCYLVGIGQLCYWVWYSRRRLAQWKEESQERRGQLFQTIQERKR